MITIDKMRAALKVLREPRPIDHRVLLTPNQAANWRAAGLPETGMVEITLDPRNPSNKPAD